MAIAAGDNVGSHIPNSCQFESALDNCHLPSVVDASIIYAYTGKEERDSSDSSFYRQVQSSRFLQVCKRLLVPVGIFIILTRMFYLAFLRRAMLDNSSSLVLSSASSAA